MTDALQALTLPPEAEAAIIAETVRTHGVAVLPAYLSANELDALNSEFNAFVGESQSNPLPGMSISDEGLTIPVVRNRMDASAKPATAELFGRPFMRAVSEAYFGSSEIGLNHQIYVNLNRGVDAPVDQLPFIPHFDKIPTLKFFFYLSDTAAGNGALGGAPGSHVANRAVREDALARLGHTRDIANVKPAETLIPLEGPAGTLLVFHTDMTHGAGWVRPGLERRVMRGHTRTMDVLRAHRLDHQAA